MKWAQHSACKNEIGKHTEFYLEEKISLRRPWCRWEENIKIDFLWANL
jgi:hypothetical protein